MIITTVFSLFLLFQFVKSKRWKEIALVHSFFPVFLCMARAAPKIRSLLHPLFSHTERHVPETIGISSFFREETCHRLPIINLASNNVQKDKDEKSLLIFRNFLSGTLITISMLRWSWYAEYQSLGWRMNSLFFCSCGQSLWISIFQSNLWITLLKREGKQEIICRIQQHFNLTCYYNPEKRRGKMSQHLESTIVFVLPHLKPLLCSSSSSLLATLNTTHAKGPEVEAETEGAPRRPHRAPRPTNLKLNNFLFTCHIWESIM